MLLCFLRRNVEASCHTFRRRLPPSTNSAAYQQVSSTRRGPSRLCIALFTARDGARYWLTNRDFCLLHLHIRRPR